MCNILISELIPNEPAYVKDKYDMWYDDIRINGIQKAVKIWRFEEGIIVVHGHHRVKISKDLGRKEVPVTENARPGDIDLARWTAEKRRLEGFLGFESFPEVASISERCDLNNSEKDEFYGYISHIELCHKMLQTGAMDQDQFDKIIEGNVLIRKLAQLKGLI